jgi:hypothetical protein
MSVLDYCVMVQRGVLTAKPAPSDPSFQLWFADTGRASTAVGNALEGRNDVALRVAEVLAERYHVVQ